MSKGKPPRFPLGAAVATPGALALLDEDVQMNEAAVGDSDRILSSYPVGDAKVWVITEADRSSTTLLLPDEY